MEEITINTSLCLYAIMAGYIISGVTCAYVKWRHVCLPYKGKEYLYFPNRYHWIFLFASGILLSGCLINPHNPENWIVARCFIILTTPNFIITGIIKQCTARQQRNFSALMVYSFPNYLAIALAVLAWFHTGLISQYENVIFTIAATFGGFFTLGIIPLIFWLRKQINYYYENKYSNEENFPTNFASSFLPKMFVYVPIPWIIFVTDNPLVMSVGFGLETLAQIILCTWSLDAHIEVLPKIQQPTEEEFNAGEMDDDSDDQIQIDSTENEQVLTALNQLMDNQKPYLDSKLTIMDVAKMLKTNVPTLRVLCKDHYGSFIKMVNSYRLGEAREMSKLHPQYSKQAIAEASGFGSYRSMLRAEKAENPD